MDEPQDPPISKQQNVYIFIRFQDLSRYNQRQEILNRTFPQRCLSWLIAWSYTTNICAVNFYH